MEAQDAQLTPEDRADLTYYYLVLGKEGSFERACALALRTTRELIESSQLARAARLLRRIVKSVDGDSESGKTWMLRFTELLSEVYERAGDHDLAVEVLDDWEVQNPRVNSIERARLKRRFGIHLHRAGRAEEATRELRELSLIHI